jgi:hypothetical protein
MLLAFGASAAVNCQIDPECTRKVASAQIAALESEIGWWSMFRHLAGAASMLVAVTVAVMIARPWGQTRAWLALLVAMLGPWIAGTIERPMRYRVEKLNAVHSEAMGLASALEYSLRRYPDQSDEILHKFSLAFANVLNDDGKLRAEADDGSVRQK